MIAPTNKLNIKYKPWKVYGTKDNVRTAWAELSQDAADKKEAELEKDGWADIKIIVGKEIEAEKEVA